MTAIGASANDNDDEDDNNAIGALDANESYAIAMDAFLRGVQVTTTDDNLIH